MKKKCMTMTALALASALALAGCNANPERDPGLGFQPRARYQTVPYGTGELSGADAKDGARLLYSVRDNAAGTDHYMFYLGYVANVPIAYKDAVYYNGQTPLTLTYERSSATEESISRSMTRATEFSFGGSITTTVGMEIEGEVGIPLIAGAKAKATASTSISASFGFSASTSNTYETARASSEGESWSVSATIGGNNEPAGMYRYALFGITDVYYLVVVGSQSREVVDAKVVNSARPASLAWALDYAPREQDIFGKTGGGAPLAIPDIDFNNISPPSDEDQTEALVQTTLTVTLSDGKRIRPGQSHSDQLEADFNMAALEALGYSHFEVHVDTRLYVNNNSRGQGHVRVTAFHGHDSTADYHVHRWGLNDLPQNGAHVFVSWLDNNFGRANFGAADQKFTILWESGCSRGTNDTDYVLESRTITLIAVKG